MNDWGAVGAGSGEPSGAWFPRGPLLPCGVGGRSGMGRLHPAVGDGPRRRFLRAVLSADVTLCCRLKG